MSIDVVIEAAAWRCLTSPRLPKVRPRQPWPHLGVPPDLDIALLACDDTRISALNADFRGKPQPTNVLSWPSEERGAETPGAVPDLPTDPELGDIAIAYETCAREAQEANTPFEAHVTHLIVHGSCICWGMITSVTPMPRLWNG